MLQAQVAVLGPGLDRDRHQVLAVLAVGQPHGGTVGRLQQLFQVLDRQPIGAAAADADPATLAPAAPATHASAPDYPKSSAQTARRPAPISQQLGILAPFLAYARDRALLAPENS